MWLSKWHPNHKKLSKSWGGGCVSKRHPKFREGVEAINKVHDHRANLRLRSQPHWPLSPPCHSPSLFYRKKRYLFFSSLKYAHPWCTLRIVIVILKELCVTGSMKWDWLSEWMNTWIWEATPSCHFMGNFHKSYTLDLIITQGLHVLWPLTTSIPSWFESH